MSMILTETRGNREKNKSTKQPQSYAMIGTKACKISLAKFQNTDCVKDMQADGLVILTAQWPFGNI